MYMLGVKAGGVWEGEKRERESNQMSTGKSNKPGA
jgi:hypothetical protein